MILYPALDLKNQQCVRLYQGDFNQSTTYSDDPITTAKNFITQGATWLHVIDLDGAKDSKNNQHFLIGEIAQNLTINIQVGGGIRETSQIKNLLDRGVTRVIIGSQAINNPEETKNWLKQFGAEKIVLALDVMIKNQDAWIAIHGWQTTSGKKLQDLLDYYQKNVIHILCTDISRDGTMQGPNLDLYKTISQRYATLQLQASGGIGSLTDVKLLKNSKIAGAIMGRALYEQKFQFSEALTC